MAANKNKDGVIFLQEQTEPTPEKKPGKARNEREKADPKKLLIGACVVLAILVITGIFGVVNVTAGGQIPVYDANDGMPEFFSTIRPESTATPNGGYIPVRKTAFTGALFVGDSLTYRLEDYVLRGAGSATDLQDATFATDGDYSWTAAAEEENEGENSLYLNGESLSLYGAIEKSACTKLYIQLGKNDLIENDVNTVTNRAKTVLEAIHARYPALTITVQSVTPMLQWIDYKGLSSRTIFEYNDVMQAYCETQNWVSFLNLAGFFTDGYLPAEYCADPGQMCIHLNEAGCALWTSFLLGQTTLPTPEPSPTPEPPPGAESEAENYGNYWDEAENTYGVGRGDETPTE